MSDFEATGKQIERIAALVRDNWERDARFRALVDSAVASAMADHGPIDPTRAREAAHRIARAAVASALTRAFDDDAELKFTREMLEKMREMTFQTLSMTSPAPVILKAAEPS